MFSDDEKEHDFHCALAIQPFGDKPTLIGTETIDNSFKPLANTRSISAQLSFVEMSNYDYVIDCKIECQDPPSDDAHVGHTSDILIRLNRNTVVEHDNKPSCPQFRLVSGANVEFATRCFNLDGEEFSRHIKTRAEKKEDFYMLRIPYAKHPPSARLETQWTTHGSHQAKIDRIRQCFSKNGTLYALFHQNTTPGNLVQKFATAFGTFRKCEPLSKIYFSGTILMPSTILPKETRPKLDFPAQTVFTNWFQYATIMGLGAIQDEEEDAARFEPTGSSIKLVSVPGVQNGRYHGLLEHNDRNYRLHGGDMIKICFSTPEGPSATATVVRKDFSDKAGTVSLLVRRDVNGAMRRWNEKVPIAAVGTSRTASTLDVRRAMARATPIHVTYQAHDEGKAIHIYRSLEALKVITQKPELLWARNALLGRRIIAQEPIDMYAGIERDEKASEALWLAMARLNPRQTAAMESARSLPSGVGIVEGPPGTGKTFLIANMVQPLVHAERRAKSNGPPVLLLSTSNLSVDDIAVRVKAICDETGRALSSGNEMTVVRLHSMGTERLLFLNSFSPYHNVEIIDERLKLKDYSLAHLMLQMPGKEDLFGRLRELCRQCFERRDDSKTDEKLELDKLLEELRVAALKRADVVVATLGVAGDRELFSVIQPSAIIVDEASRATDPDIWPIFARYPKGTKILVGDSQQLQPAANLKNSLRAQRALSALTRLRHLGYPATLLVEQHRSVNAIAQIYSDITYGGSLITPSRVDAYLEQQARHFRVAMKEAYSLKVERNVLLFSIETGKQQLVHASKSYFNTTNVRVVMDAVMKLVSKDIPPAEIAILVPYTAQLALYDFAQSELADESPSISEVLLETFDSVQGREFDYVIVDFVRTKDIGFLREDNRVNVAISRARYGLILVLNDHSLSAAEGWYKDYEDYEESIYEKSSLYKVGKHLRNSNSVRTFTSARVAKCKAIPGLEETASSRARSS